MGQPRKKRRPSYWDGDLKQVMKSPAGRQEQVRSLQPGAERQVMTSPAKEDVESMRVSVREDENDEAPAMVEDGEEMMEGVEGVEDAGKGETDVVEGEETMEGLEVAEDEVVKRGEMDVEL